MTRRIDQSNGSNPALRAAPTQPLTAPAPAAPPRSQTDRISLQNPPGRPSSLSEVVASAKARSADQPKGNQIVDAARSLVQSGYVYPPGLTQASGYTHVPNQEGCCADFVVDAMAKAGVDVGSKMQNPHYCPSQIDYWQRTNQWVPKGGKAQVGDAIYFDWNHDGTADHTAIVTKVDANGNPTEIAESYNFNQKARLRPLGPNDLGCVVGFGRPSGVTADNQAANSLPQVGPSGGTASSGGLSSTGGAGFGFHDYVADENKREGYPDYSPHLPPTRQGGAPAPDYVPHASGPVPPLPKEFKFALNDEQIAKSLGLPVENVKQNWPYIAQALQQAGITDPNTIIAVLGTMKTEVGGDFGPIPESGGGAQYDGRADLGNTQPGDGNRYMGRGFIQLTGRANYREYGQKLGIDLEGHPELALDPKVASEILVQYFKDRGIPQMAQAGDWVAVRRAVNGGTNGLDTFMGAVDSLRTAVNQANGA